MVQVTTDDAHAWVEYYDYSTWTWYLLEATPGELTPTPTTQPTEAATQPVTRPEPTTAPETTQPVTEPIPEPTAAQPTALWIPALSTVAILLLLEVQRLVRIRIRSRRQQRGSKNRQAAARWPELQRMFRLLGGKPPEGLRQLTEKALFSQHALSDGELAQFEACAAACRTALRQRPWYRRLLFRYWYAVL